jgi:RHS repeat-associated protein
MAHDSARGQVVEFGGYNASLVNSSDTWAFGAVQATSLSVTDLGVGAAYGINNQGQIVGSLTTLSGSQHAFVWQNGVSTDLGALAGFPQSSVARAINDGGQVVGSSTSATGDYHAFIWTQSSGMKDLGALDGSRSIAFGINNSGLIVGSFVPSTSSGYSHAAEWTATGAQDLGTLGSPNGTDTFSAAKGITSEGLIVGATSTSSSFQHACIFHNGSILDIQDAAGLTLISFANAVNSNGQIAGEQDGPGNTRAFLYSGGVRTFLDLSSLHGGEAFAINDGGQVVGSSSTSSNRAHAFLYTTGFVVDLNDWIPPDSGWELTSAFGINDKGLIVGSGMYHGQQHGFLLTLALPVIQVSTNLSAASFVISGPAVYSGSGTMFNQTTATPGKYTIVYAPVAGYAPPTSQTQTLVAGGIITFNGSYSPLSAPPASVTYGQAGTTISPTVSVREPVNTATGNYYSTLTDLSIPGKGLSFVFTRSYNSQDSYTGPLGASWSHSYNVSLAIDGTSGNATVTHGDRHQEVWVPGTGGALTPQTRGLFNVLVKNADGSFTLTFKNQTKYTFSTAGKLAAVTDRNGNSQALSYDGGGKLISITDTSGRVFTLAYDSNGHITSLTDPLKRQLQYSYDGNGNLISFQDAAGAMTSYAYDASHRMTSATDPRGNIYLQNTYDGQGRVVSQKNARGFITAFAYASPSAGTTTVTDPVGNSTQYVYDIGLRLSATIDAAGNQTQYTYDANNLRASVTDALGRQTAFTYDSSGNLTGRTDAAGNVTAYVYDSQNNLVSFTDANTPPRVTKYTYDAAGNLLTTTDPAGGVTTNTYDASGQLASTKNARGFITSFQYDSYGDRTQVTDALKGATQMTYDLAGHLLTTKNPLGKTWTSTYDADDRLLTSTDPLGNQTSYSYDANGNRTQVTDANGNTTAYAYDANNNLGQLTDAAGGVTTYAYNGNDDRTGITDANSHTTTLAYDSLRRLLSRTDPLNRAQKYSYDAVGNLTSTLDGNGKTNIFAYDALNRRLSATLSDKSSVAYTYDAVGNRLTMTDWRGTTSFNYDALNRVMSVTQPGAVAVGYSYDAVGNRSSITYPDGKVVLYQYDELNRLTQAKDWSNQTTAYAYDAAGNLTSTTLPNGASTSYLYDAANRLLNITNRAGTQVLSAYTYLLDKVGNRLEVASFNEGVQRYGYDMLYRLTSWVSPSRQIARYRYDAVGNRTVLVAPTGATVYSYDSADELLTAGTTAYTYDANGNQISKTAAGVTTIYGWDPLNRLNSVTGGGVNTQYQYDGDSNRVGQKTIAGTYTYVNDTAATLPAVVNEIGPDGNIIYVYGSSLISASVGGLQSFYQFDGLGSVSAITDPTKTEKASYVYDPWGYVLGGFDSLGSKNKFKFAGESMDLSTGLVYLRARYYDAVLGKFISRDTKPAPAPLDSAYRYALSNPIRFSDPTGHGPGQFFGEAFGFAEWGQQAREQRQAALDCVLNDPGCDVDAAQRQYYGIEQQAYSRAYHLTGTGLETAYDLDPSLPSSSLGIIHEEYGLYKGLKDGSMPSQSIYNTIPGINSTTGTPFTAPVQTVGGTAPHK